MLKRDVSNFIFTLYPSPPQILFNVISIVWVEDASHTHPMQSDN